MLSCLLRGRSMSQRLSILLLVFGLAWCLLLLHYTVTQPRHQSSAELRQQILELSQRYVKALSTENQHFTRPYNPSMAGYADLKRTIAVLLDDILNRLVKLENRLDATVNTSVHSPSHMTGTVLHRTTKQNESGTNANNNQIQPQPLM